MTITEAQSSLFDYFLSQDVFELKNFKKVFLTVGDEKIEEQIILEALTVFEDRNLIKKLNLDSPTWALVKSLSQYEQSISISPVTASAISNIINKECAAHKDDENLCNPVNILEDDVKNILRLLISANHELSEVNKDKSELE